VTVPTNELLDAASRLHGYLMTKHWNGQALEGPDSGVRFNSRIGRFVKSYLDFLPWSDNRIYFQAQGYWILDNWLMADLLNNRQAADLALSSTEYVVAAQRPEGYWEYPDPERKGKIATVEGDYATLGLLETYYRTRQELLLAAAKKWHRFLINEIRFQENNGLLAINYFANIVTNPVPNNTTLTLRTLAKLADATNDESYLTPCRGMVAWLNQVQQESGEFPYTVGGPQGSGRPHFLCYQYNAFEFLDLTEYYRISGDEAIRPILEKLALFLSSGITESGAVRYNCDRKRPEVHYYTAAVAEALSQATALGLGNFRPLADRAFRWVLSHQRADGGSQFFSRGNYRLLSDRRSYPRNLSMILYHLLLELQVDAHQPKNEQHT
jgi:hypothetical protein